MTRINSIHTKNRIQTLVWGGGKRGNLDSPDRLLHLDRLAARPKHFGTHWRTLVAGPTLSTPLAPRSSCRRRGATTPVERSRRTSGTRTTDHPPPFRSAETTVEGNLLESGIRQYPLNMSGVTFNAIKRREAQSRLAALKRSERSAAAADAQQERASLVGDSSKWRITNLKAAAKAMASWQ